MEAVNPAMGETPTIKTLDETETSSQPGTPAPPQPPSWTEGSPQGFSHRYSRTRKVTARRNNITPAPSYILDMMRTDPHVEFNTIDLTCDDDTLKLHSEQLANDYSTLTTNGTPAGESYPNLNSSDCFRKLSSTPGLESFDGLGITIDRSEYVPTEDLQSAVIHERPAHDALRTGGTSLKPGVNWLHTGLDPAALSQNEMLTMMLQTSEPIPRVWGRADNIEPNKSFNYPGVDLTKYGPLPQLEPIPPTFSEKRYQDAKLPPPYPYIVPPSDLIPAKDVKREVVPPMELSGMSCLESMQVRWSERMSSSASSECSTSIGSRIEDKCTSQIEQPNKRRRTALHAPTIEPHLWTRKGLRPCAARLARSAEETMQLNSPMGDKDDTSSSWKMDVLSSQEPPSPQYSDISDAPSIPVSVKTSQHSRSNSVSPHGSSLILTESAAENSKSPKMLSKVSSGRSSTTTTHGLKHCAVRVPRCSSQLSVCLSSSTSSRTSEKVKQFEVDAPSTDMSPTLNVGNSESLGDAAPFKCSSCHLHFWKEDLFREHACLGRPWHQCPLCLSRFLSIPNLQRHMATKHSDESGNQDPKAQDAEQELIKSSNKHTDQGMSEGDIHEWLFSVWEYNKDKPIPPEGIKCLFCDKVCFQVLSMKAHLLGVHKINLFNRQFQSARKSQILELVKSKDISNNRSTQMSSKAKDKFKKRTEKVGALSDSNFNSSSSNLTKAKSGAELKQKIASLLMREIEKSKQKMIKTQTNAMKEQAVSSEPQPLSVASNDLAHQDSTKLSNEVRQAPNGVVEKTVGLAKGNKKVRFQYVRSLCQTLFEKNVTVVQLRNWLLEITSQEFEKYECILCKKVFMSLKSMQCHCLSVHRIPPGIKNFKPIWRGMRALKTDMIPQVQKDANESVEKSSPLPNADVKIDASPDLKRNLTNSLTKNLRKLLIKSRLVDARDCEDDVDVEVRDVVQYAVHSVSEEEMVASMKQFHPPVIMGIVKEEEDPSIASKLDKEPPSDHDIDKWLMSLKSAANGEHETDHQLECLMCSETYGNVESMAVHVNRVHCLTGLPVPSSTPQPNTRTAEDVDTQAEVADGTDQLSVPLLPVMDLTDLRMYIKLLLMRMYSEETLLAFGFPECSTDLLLMRILDHGGFSYCWFTDESDEMLCNALCRNLKTLLAVSLPPEMKTYVHLNSNPVPMVLKALLDYTANEQISQCIT